MQVTLTAMFDSVEEMHDWVLKTAEGLRPGPDPVKAVHEIMAGGETVITGAYDHDAPKSEPVKDKPKPKRKRRTKAEMAAARAAEAAEKESVERASDGDVGDEHGGNGAGPQIVVDEKTLRLAYAEAFRGVLESRLEEGIALVKGAGLKRFSEGSLEQQVGILKSLDVEIPAP